MTDVQETNVSSEDGHGSGSTVTERQIQMPRRVTGYLSPVPYTFSTYNSTVMGCRSQYRYRYETPSSDHPGGYPQLKPYT